MGPYPQLAADVKALQALGNTGVNAIIAASPVLTAAAAAVVQEDTKRLSSVTVVTGASPDATTGFLKSTTGTSSAP